jgi:transcriptional regulator with XRE-family HTH domain
MSDVGERLRELRVKAGLSQRDLADLVGVGFPHISKVESGKERPSDDLLRSVALHLDVEVDELLILAERLPDEATADLLKIVSGSTEQRVMATTLLRKWASGGLDASDNKALKKIVKEDD